MGKKLEAGDPKALSRHMESRGLKKLKYYCQMCNKQCTDQNGFKCHLNSQHHKDQMRRFAEDQKQYLDEFSQQFESNFLQLLKTRFFGQQYHINKIYMEYIKDKQHVHMNATRWATLTEFAYYLERTKKVEVEPADKGVYITLIDKTQQTFEKQKEQEKKERQELKLQRLHEQRIQQQIEKAKEIENQVIENLEKKYEENQPNSTGPIAFSMKKKPDFQEEDEEEDFGISNKKTAQNISNGFSFKSLKRTNDINQVNEQQDKTSSESIKPISGMELLQKKLKKNQEPSSGKKEKQKEEQEIQDINETPWIKPGIIVKIKDKKLQNGSFYKKKAHVYEVIEEFLAKIEVLDTKQKISMDQEFLETVIPKKGNKVMVLKPGEFQGEIGILESLYTDQFSGAILLDKDSKTCVEMPYEYFSKIHQTD